MSEQSEVIIKHSVVASAVVALVRSTRGEPPRQERQKDALDLLDGPCARWLRQACTEAAPESLPSQVFGPVTTGRNCPAGRAPFVVSWQQT